MTETLDLSLFLHRINYPHLLRFCGFVFSFWHSQYKLSYGKYKILNFLVN